ncbi:uncharacterized protein LOC130618404 [Hydractinia symbiolongicarpus]|uniref:uncharacterized protein LOC130618404 n=1 Tax=Hydractinia symbiolongicarpus TaxID=13093 RepID=UPI00254D308E|nr:uncharacterized protein LOC130618404 [Hydractinia symbiolongicarpus]
MYNCPCQQRDIEVVDRRYLFEFDINQNKYCPDPDNLINKTFTPNVHSKYYDTHEFHKLKTETHKNKCFSAMHTSIESLMHNFDSLHSLLSDLDHNFDVIAVSETWNSKARKSTFRPGILDGYHEYVGQVGNSLKGGCGMYIKENIKFKERNDLSVSFIDENNEYQSKWIKIINNKSANILTAVFYRHPKKSTDVSFTNHIENTLQKLKKEHKNIILLGDFNYCLLNYETNKEIRRFVECLYDHFLQPCITQPTRTILGAKPSLIDNIFTNIVDKDISSGNLISKITDHMPNFIFVQNLVNMTQNDKITKRDFSKFNEILLERTKNFTELSSNVKNIATKLEKLESTFQQDIVKLKSNYTIYKDFQEQLVSVINKHAPLKTYSKRESKYKYYCKHLKQLIKTSKAKYYKEYFSVHLNNSKKVWKGVNEIINKRKKIGVGNIFLSENDSIVTDQKKVANMFNEFYGSVAKKLVEKLPKPITQFQDYLKNPNEHSIFLTEVDPGEVYLLLCKLDSKKAADIYGISPKFLKIAAPAISSPIAQIINKSFELGKYPSLLKTAKVIPVHKGDSKLDVSNYRPISLLPVVSKIFEKVMFDRLYNFVTKMNLLHSKQYGFQKNKSTDQAILDLQANIVERLEKGEISCAIFLDFAKAFDTVNHRILIQKLNFYGVRGLALDWFSSYLTNRTQCVSVKNSNSHFINIENGVPQGSVLGPLLFLLYINDIVTASPVLQFYLFADDTVYSSRIKTDKHLKKS